MYVSKGTQLQSLQKLHSKLQLHFHPNSKSTFVVNPIFCSLLLSNIKPRTSEQKIFKIYLASQTHELSVKK